MGTGELGLAYQYFYRKVSGYADYVFRVSDKDEVQLTKFMDRYGKSIGGNGVSFLFDFLSYQFAYWAGFKGNRFGENRIMLNWVFGQKACDRWDKDDWRTSNYVGMMASCSKKLTKYGISGKEFRAVFGVGSVVVTGSSNYMDAERMRYINTDIGLLHCLDTTSMFDADSDACSMCNDKNECNEIKGSGV